MPKHLHHALTDKELKAIKPGDTVIKKTDGGGLHLRIEPTGVKRWVMAYRINGDQKNLGLGSYPAVSLADARRKAEDTRRQVEQGIDPAATKRAAKAAPQAPDAPADNGPTFQTMFERLMAKKRSSGRAEATITRDERTGAHLLRQIKDVPVSKGEVKPLAAALETIAAENGNESARRARSLLGEVYRLAMAQGEAKSDPSVALRGIILTERRDGYSAITDETAFGHYLTAIRQYPSWSGLTAIYLKLVALTACRPGELRLAKWDWLDLDKAELRLPASTTKTRTGRTVYLSRQAVALFRQLHELRRGDYLFPAVHSSNKPMSDGTARLALQRMGFSKDEVSVHGSRKSFSTICNECGLARHDVIEAALGHEDKNAIRGIYNRATYLQEQRNLMQAWADRCDELMK